MTDTDRTLGSPCVEWGAPTPIPKSTRHSRRRPRCTSVGGGSYSRGVVECRGLRDGPSSRVSRESLPKSPWTGPKVGNVTHGRIRCGEFPLLSPTNQDTTRSTRKENTRHRDGCEPNAPVPRVSRPPNHSRPPRVPRRSRGPSHPVSVYLYTGGIL